MRRFAFLIPALCSLLVLAPSSGATGCRVIAPVQVVQPVAVVTPFVSVVQAVPVVAYPAYSASYAGTSTSELQAATAELKLAAAELRGYTAGLAASQKAPPAPLTPPKALLRMAPAEEQTSAPASLVQTNCAACHSAETAKARGTSLAWFAGGKQRALSPEEMGEALERVLDGRMPRGRTLSAAERNQVALELMRQQAKQ